LICIDLELAWGWVATGRHRHAAGRLMRGREAMPRILDLFDRFGTPATWATVGHLFLSSCERRDGRPHPEITRPEYAWRGEDWYHDDPASTQADEPLWYGADLVAHVRSRTVGHEIGSHSFSHILFGDPGCSRDAAAADVAAAVDAAARNGITLSSFVFPRHSPGHMDVLRDYGFSVYRGDLLEPFIGLPRAARRPLRFLAMAASLAPRTTAPVRGGAGLVHVPASMHFALPPSRAGAAITWRMLARRAIRGIRRAERRREVFTMFFHDHNFGVRTDDHLRALNEILAFAADRRERGVLDISTMSELAADAGSSGT
jgi:peptidoglycan/xylan/chitin deacetylase (PgdA/CDA1 family)